MKLTTIFSLFLLFAVGFALLNFGRLPAHAAGASISLSLTYGPPTSSILASGKGFKSREVVTLLFDTTQVGTATANTKGTISSTITVPASALPGNHFVQAKGKSSGLFAQAAFLVQTDWVQQGFNREHTGFNVFENVLNTGNVGLLNQSWWYNSNSWTSSITVAHGVIYFACYQTYVCALSGTTGQLLWSHNINEMFAAIPAVANNLVYMNTTGGHVDALNMTTGALVWSYLTGFSMSGAPLTANGLVYVGASNGVLYALNGITGQVVWTHAFLSAFPTPSVDGNLLYVSAGGTLYALKYQNGQIVWHAPANGGTPVIANGMIYMNDTADNKLIAMSEKNGAFQWSRTELTYPTNYSDPAVANGVVYITVPNNCNLEALSGTTGAVLWQYDTTSDTVCLQGNPIVANGVVYAIASENYAPDCYCSAVYMISAATGTSVGEVEDYNGDYPDSVIVVNGTLYYAATGSVYAYHLPV